MSFLLSIALLSLTPSSWLTDLSEAQQIARKTTHPILLVFSGSDWCRPCMKLKMDVFETEAFKAFADQELVLLAADFPRSKKHQLTETQQAHNATLAERYNPSGAFPKLLLLDAEGGIISTLEYHGQGSSQFIAEIKDALPASHPK